jgi:hypothetical protein
MAFLLLSKNGKFLLFLLLPLSKYIAAKHEGFINEDFDFGI